ncbi:MAG: tRNA (guanosine(37)-N1)-methyltransferase TrmD [candidate division Zixibacteria bacterium]|nr:tRNA (guanosine(37)-N1)-methyltransferase TrmD [candidate division Zixibacteria bacterium]
MAPALAFDIITIFPTFFEGSLAAGVLGKALERGLLEARVHDLRAYADDAYRSVDDYPYGGGVGMVMKAEPFFRAVDDVEAKFGRGWRVFLTPQGRPLVQSICRALAAREHIVLLCGRYKGVDERVRQALADEEISIGDFVTSGGEVAALALVEATARLIPGVLGDEDSAASDSFATGLLDHPHYTRPREFRGMAVPEVLLSGDHAEIEKWRREQALKRTREVRPEMLEDKG